ncbi:hypothetical protein LWX53_01735, partial [bacterium]|nr:hypothetical protein [bacterium]
MSPLYAFATVMVIFAISDLISTKTKAIVSSLFAASVLFLAGLWLNIIPKTVFTDSGLTTVGAVSTGLLVTHMGTLISLKEFAKQWKTVLIAAAGLVGIFLLVYFVGTPLVGKQFAATAVPPIAGGVIAAQIMMEGGKALGSPAVSLLALLLLVLQGFVGYPVASICLKKEAANLAKEYSGIKDSGKAAGAAAAALPVKKLLPAFPKDYNSIFVLLAKLSLISVLSFWLSGVLKPIIDINKNIMCLILGIAFSEIGFLDTDILTKSNSYGIAMAGLLGAVFAGLAQATPAMVGQLIVPVIITLALGTVGIGIGSILVGKLLKQSWAMSFAIG